MNRRSFPPVSGLWALLTALMTAAVPLPGADTNAVAAPEYPQSVFTLPTRPEEGRDPFFPKSQRPYARALPAAATNTAPVLSAALLELKGLMGTPARRLATINNQTFAVGDEMEVNTTAGRLLVRCLEIRDRSVVVEAGMPPRRVELFLREKF